MGGFSIVLFEIGLNLGWVYLFMGVIIGPAVIPLWNLMTWKKASGTGAIIAAWGGLAIGLTAWFVTAVIQSGSISVDTLGTNEVMLSGNLFSILSSGAIHFIYSWFIDPQDYDFTKLDENITLVEDDRRGLSDAEMDPVVLEKAEQWIKRRGKALGTTFPESEHFYGLENFGNTCYANSVLQALYYCMPMREHCIAYSAQCEGTEDDLLSSLCDLFVSISNQRRRCGVHAPRRFIAKLRNENELFNNQMHQDAHEFLNYLLNEAAELLEKREKKATGKSAGRAGSEASASDEPSTPPPYKAKTWIHSIFEGGLSSLSTGIARPTYSPRTPHVLPTYSPRTPHVLLTYSPRTPHVLPTCSPRTPHVLPTYSPRAPHVLPTSSPRTPHVLPTYSPRTPRAQAHDLHRTPPSR